MPAVKLTNHLSNDIVQVETRLCIRQQNRIFLFDCFPIHTMHILQIKTITISTPGLIEDLRPLLGIIYRNGHIIHIDRRTQISRSFRYSGYIKLVVLVEQSLLTTRSNRHHSTIGNRFFFLTFKIEKLRSAIAPVIYFLSV